YAARDFLGDEPFPGAHKKAAGAAGRVANAEVWFTARIGFHDAADGLYERAWSEILAGAFLAFAGGFFEQAFERRAFDIDIHRGPILLIDHGDDALEVDRVIEARCGLRKDVAENAGLFAQLAEDVGVVIGQRGAGFIFETVPIEGFGDGRATLVGHL